MKKVIAILVAIFLLLTISNVEASPVTRCFSVDRYCFSVPRNMELSYISSSYAQLSLYNKNSISLLDITINPLDMENSASSINQAKTSLQHAAQQNENKCEVFEYIERDQMDLVFIIEKTMISECAWYATFEIDVFTTNDAARFLTKQIFNTADDSYERAMDIYRNILNTISYNQDAEPTTFYMPTVLIDASELLYSSFDKSYVIYDRSKFGISYGYEDGELKSVSLVFNPIAGSQISIYSSNDELIGCELSVDKDTYADLYFDDILYMCISSFTGYDDNRVSSVMNYLATTKTVDKKSYYHEKSDLLYGGCYYSLCVSPFDTVFSLSLLDKQGLNLIN